MVFQRFWNRIRAYGIKRVLLDTDLIISVLIVFITATVDYLSCHVSAVECADFTSGSFVGSATDLAISFTVFIVSGLAILVAFTDSRFIKKLKDIGVYQNIMFVFEYTIYLAISASVVGVILNSYGTTPIGYYIFLFLFIYMILSAVNLVQLIVSFGNKKAQFELNNSG
jgi:hypothetical protein